MRDYPDDLKVKDAERYGEVLHLYEITYEYNGKHVCTHRFAQNAVLAAERHVYQHEWYCTLRIYDADTRGVDWAQVSVSRDCYGNEWLFTAFVKKIA